MRHLFKLFLLLLVISACSDETLFREPSEEPGNGKQQLNNLQMRTMDEVLEIAANASSMVAPDGAENGLSRGLGRVVDPSCEVVPIGKAKSRSAGDDALMYVVNYADNNGFAVVSANKNAPEVLAVTEKGHFSSEENIEIEGFQIWLDETVGYLDALAEIKSNSGGQIWDIDTMKPGIRPKTVRDTVWYKRMKDQVSVAWGQGFDTIVPNACEGYECPNQVSGCVNTAIAMAMSYLERPASINLTYLSNSPTLTLNWTELKKYLSFKDNVLQPFPSSTYPIRTNISKLLREIGERTHSNYTHFGETGATAANAEIALKQLGLIDQSMTWQEGTGVEIYNWMYGKQSCIALAGGVESKNGSGHMWIVDGLLNFKIRERYYESEDGGKTWKLKDTSYSEEYYYVHQNWGWHGYCNGYYYHVDPNARKKMNIIHTFDVGRIFIPIVK